jgi:hypothetical protein
MAKNIGVRQKVLEILATKKGLSSSELQQMIGTTSGSIAIVMKKLHAEKLVYISGWKRSYGTRGRMGAKWSLGSHFDTEQPLPNRKADNKRYLKRLDPTIKRLRWQKYHGTYSVWSPLKKLG